jgi:hypothetical protein
VTPGLRFFRAERGSARVDLAESRSEGFDVKLPGLRKERLLVVDIVDFEQRGRAFARGGGKDRRLRERVTQPIEEIAAGANRLGANAQDRSLARRSDPQMSAIKEKIDAVLLELDGIGI